MRRNDRMTLTAMKPCVTRAACNRDWFPKTFPRWGCVRKNWVIGSMRSPYEGSLPAVRKHHDAGFVCYMDGLEVVRLTMTRLISKVKEFLRRRVTKKLGGGKTNDS